MKIKLLIRNVNMGNSHDGLATIARTFKLEPSKLSAQECIMFLNRAGDKLKILGHAGIVIGYLRMPKGRKIFLEAIQWLPLTFHAQGRFDYDAALKLALTQALGTERDRKEKKKLRLSPLEAYRHSRAIQANA